MTTTIPGEMDAHFWAKDHHQIYLIGNPFVWWSSTASMLVRGFLILRAKRGYRDFENTKVVKYDALCGFLFTGYVMHYLPFFLMSRQLFLHHYFPALYFSVLLSCAVFDFATSTMRPKVRLQVAGVLVIVAVWHFGRWSPLAYGTPWTKEQCQRAQWVKSWDFACNEFLDSYAQYDVSPGPTLNVTPAASVPVATIGGEPGGRAQMVVVDEVQAPPLAVEEEGVNTRVPSGIVAAPGKDVFATEREGVRSIARMEMDRDKDRGEERNGDGERVVSVVSGAGEAPRMAFEVAPEPVPESEPEVADVSAQVPEPQAEGKRPSEGPLDHEEALADQVAHELYPEAREAEEVRDE